MSIKAIHIFLISCAVVLSFLFAVWSYTQMKNGAGDFYCAMSISSFVVGLGLAFYGVHFIKKAKTMV